SRSAGLVTLPRTSFSPRLCRGMKLWCDAEFASIPKVEPLVSGRQHALEPLKCGQLTYPFVICGNSNDEQTCTFQRSVLRQKHLQYWQRHGSSLSAFEARRSRPWKDFGVAVFHPPATGSGAAKLRWLRSNRSRREK